MDAEIRGQLRRISNLPFYAQRALTAGIDLTHVETWEQFQELPLLSRADFEDCFENDTAWGGFRVPGVVRMNFTPSARLGLLPEFHTPSDLAASARALAAVARAAGITADDVVQVTLAYHVLVAARLFDEGFAELGACSLQAGAVPTEQQLNLARRGHPTVLMSNPSFAQRLGEAGLRGIRRMVLTGEPFTAIEGRREALKDAFDGELLSAVDTYGVSECFPVAAECRAETGMHLREDFCVVEVIDSETLDPVPHGTAGELVVTHRNKQGMPLLRYRTGDLAVVEATECECGATTVLPRGVFGRTDNMTKVKGVKLYPSQVAFILAGFEGLDPRQYRITLRESNGVDQIALKVAATTTDVDIAAVKRSLKEGTLLSFNDVELVPAIDEGPTVDDLRGDARRNIASVGSAK
ncbi:hypothetical protein ASD30_00230 [Nocardioides sp. Root140]|nr:hypothetical protein ASD30_00230 [Nocardioides sp. Root140]KRF17561.1 hypothetical protein ASH02_25200 [Nocardioides sp. Soil796]